MLEVHAPHPRSAGTADAPGCLYWLATGGGQAVLQEVRRLASLEEPTPEESAELDKFRAALADHHPHVRLRPITVGDMSAIRATFRALGSGFELDSSGGEVKARMVGDPHAREMALARKLIRSNVLEVHNVVSVQGAERTPIRTGAELVDFIDASCHPALAGVIAELFLALTESSKLEAGLGEE